MSLFNNSNQPSYEKCKNRDGILKHSTKAMDLLSNSTFRNTVFKYIKNSYQILIFKCFLFNIDY